MTTDPSNYELGLRAAIADTFGRACAGAPGRCASTLDPDVPDRATCDAALVSAALSDLLENALALAQRGPVQLSASVDWLGKEVAMLRLKTCMFERVTAEKWLPISGTRAPAL